MELSFGEFIRQKRLEKGYTLRKFCAKVDVSPTFLSRMERDEVSPPAEERLVAFAEALSLDSEELIFMAKRLPNTIKKMVIERPDIVPALRSLHKKDPRELKHIMGILNSLEENKE